MSEIRNQSNYLVYSNLGNYNYQCNKQLRNFL